MPVRPARETPVTTALVVRDAREVALARLRAALRGSAILSRVTYLAALDEYRRTLDLVLDPARAPPDVVPEKGKEIRRPEVLPEVPRKAAGPATDIPFDPAMNTCSVPVRDSDPRQSLTGLAPGVEVAMADGDRLPYVDCAEHGRCSVGDDGVCSYCALDAHERAQRMAVVYVGDVSLDEWREWCACQRDPGDPRDCTDDDDEDQREHGRTVADAYASWRRS